MITKTKNNKIYTLKNGNLVVESGQWEKAYGSYTFRNYTDFYQRKENGKYRIVLEGEPERASFKNWKEQVESVR